MVRLYWRRILAVVLSLGALGVLLAHMGSFQTPRGADRTATTMTELPTEDPYAEESMIDWTDLVLLERERLRSGPGEHGEAVHLNASLKVKVPELLNVNGFNAVASDQISVDRAVKDLRIGVCRSLNYSSRLSQVSVVVPFHDEHWSTLIRTVHSLWFRAPRGLLREIILVDDFSTKPFLRGQLDEYLGKTFSNVWVVRTAKREGLIRARLLGAKEATGEVLIFIDSHCEAGINWLPPLLQPIKDGYRTVTCPFIDVIREDDFAIVPQDEGGRGAFDWNFDYKRLERLPEDQLHPERPFASPVMAGGLFAISRKWFWELGGYDEGLEVWGGEQYELSFKVWMCGGTMVDVPCSRIGHVYRKFNPFGVPGLGDYLHRNYMRIAEVWMDDWKNHLYDRRPDSYLGVDPGDLSMQKALRVRLQCRSFDWFMKVVAFDLVRHYPPKEPEPVSQGRIVSDADPRMCLDSKFGGQGHQVHLEQCISEGDLKTNGEQNFYFGSRRDIRPKGRSVCLDYPGSGRVLTLFGCHNQGGNQAWKYSLETHQMVHVNSGKCLDCKPQRSELFIGPCQPLATQRWTLGGLNEGAARSAWLES